MKTTLACCVHAGALQSPHGPGLCMCIDYHVQFISSKVIRVTAMDADEGSNAAIAYNILQSADYGKFMVEG